MLNQTGISNGDITVTVKFIRLTFITKRIRKNFESLTLDYLTMPPLRMWKMLVSFAIFMWILVFLFGSYYFYFRNNSKPGFRQPIYHIPNHGKRSRNRSPSGFYKSLPPNDNPHQFTSSHKMDIRLKSQFQMKMWFMDEGNLSPHIIKRQDLLKLWPEEADGDRIVDQLMFLPKPHAVDISAHLPGKRMSNLRSSLKYILLVGDFRNMYSTKGRGLFMKDKCPVDTCSLLGTLHVDDLDHENGPDAVIFKDRYMSGIHDFLNRTSQQIWILYLLESPVNNQAVESWVDVFNWTASYRHDSEIVVPYDKFLPYSVAKLYAPTKIKAPILRNYAASKSKKVAWLVSNCHTENRRLEYAEYLGLFIQVDMYGDCGLRSCPLDNACLEMLERDYKFYLSFENSNCKDYITEKFFLNGLRHNILPIVMGPPREDYERVAPPHSFIHVNDFDSAKELAEYLEVLDRNDTLYNEYFEWKSKGEFVNTYFWCRLCAMLHAPLQYRSYSDMKMWWSAPEICQA